MKLKMQRHLDDETANISNSGTKNTKFLYAKKAIQAGTLVH